MGILGDIRTLYHLAAARDRGATQAERLENFYRGQASAYDDFRRRLLQGRAELFAQLPVVEGGVWLDMGGGTGSSLEFFGERARAFGSVQVVDLCPSLLEQARSRIEQDNWYNAETVEADVTLYEPPASDGVDLITFSYSLTMIPDWFAAVDHARKLLKPGGCIGVVDFYVSRKHAEHTRHGWGTRTFWPAWFAADNVFLSGDHLPYLERRFAPAHRSEHRARVPYIPLARVPYYQFIGRA
jgi:S-adenosylmethionine-diacylgycerolhomoserine-N-methlytransferase